MSVRVNDIIDRQNEQWRPLDVSFCCDGRFVVADNDGQDEFYSVSFSTFVSSNGRSSPPHNKSLFSLYRRCRTIIATTPFVLVPYSHLLSFSFSLYTAYGWRSFLFFVTSWTIHNDRGEPAGGYDFLSDTLDKTGKSYVLFPSSFRYHMLDISFEKQSVDISCLRFTNQIHPWNPWTRRLTQTSPLQVRACVCALLNYLKCKFDFTPLSYDCSNHVNKSNE